MDESGVPRPRPRFHHDRSADGYVLRTCQPFDWYARGVTALFCWIDDDDEDDDKQQFNNNNNKWIKCSKKVVVY